MVMSMDAVSDQNMTSPMDDSAISSRQQESADEEINEDEQSRASGQTVVIKNQQRFKQSHSHHLSQTDDSRMQTSNIQEKKGEIQSSMVFPQVSDSETGQQHMMNVEESGPTTTRPTMELYTVKPSEDIDLKHDSLVARMRDIVEGGQQNDQRQQAKLQQNRSSSGDSLNNQTENNSKASLDSNQQQKRSRHCRGYCSRHGHHHHHHHHHHHRPSISNANNQPGAQTNRNGPSLQPRKQSTQARDHDRSTHKHHHHHHEHDHQSCMSGNGSRRSSQQATAQDVQISAVSNVESKSSTSSVSSAAQHQQQLRQSAAEDDENETKGERCMHQFSEAHQHDHHHHLHHHHSDGSQPNPHHHHHHYHRRHHHHRSHKKRLVQDDQVNDSEIAEDQAQTDQVVDTMVVSYTAGSSAGNQDSREPLKDMTGESNCCPYHGRSHKGAQQSRVLESSRDQNSSHHHHHHHHGHHHHHHHQHTSQLKHEGKSIEQDPNNDQPQASSGHHHGHHYHHRHHHNNAHHGHHHHHHHSHHHSKQRHKNKHKSSSNINIDEQLIQSTTGLDDSMKGNGIDPKIEHSDSTVEPAKTSNKSRHRDKLDSKREDFDDLESDNRMLLDQEQECVRTIDEPSNGIVRMDMSPNENSQTSGSLRKGNLSSEKTTACARNIPDVNTLQLSEQPNVPNVVQQQQSQQENKEQQIKESDLNTQGASGSDTTKNNSTHEFSSNRGNTIDRNGDEQHQAARKIPYNNSQPGFDNSERQQDQQQQIMESSTDMSDRRQRSSQPKQIIESAVLSDRRCRLCWCCCCPCSSLSNRVNSATKGDTKSIVEAPSLNANKCPTLPNVPLEEIRVWGDSFDRMMKCPDGRKIFQDFLRCEYSEENILFWIACEELKSEKDAKSIATKARDIYEDYISILSAKEVSLDSRVREVINSNIKKPTSNIFDEAQLQIYTLMHRDSYPRFINSPMYKKLAQIQMTSRKSSS